MPRKGAVRRGHTEAPAADDARLRGTSMTVSLVPLLWTLRTWTFPVCLEDPDDDADAMMPRIALAATVAAMSVLLVVMPDNV
jgi:hypothetical protein